MKCQSPVGARILPHIGKSCCCTLWPLDLAVGRIVVDLSDQYVVAVFYTVTKSPCKLQ